MNLRLTSAAYIVNGTATMYTEDSRRAHTAKTYKKSNDDRIGDDPSDPCGL